MYIKGNYLKLVPFCILSLLLIFSITAYVGAELSSKDTENKTKNFIELSNRIQRLAKSDKALSILKLEYQIDSLPEFVVIRKLQTSILQTFYTAYDIGYVGLCYRFLDFDDEHKMKQYFQFFLSVADVFNDSSDETIAYIDKNLSINDRYLEKQYPDFSSILLELKTDIASLRDFVNNFVKENIPESYVSAYSGVDNKLAMKRKENIILAHADYPPPKGFTKHLAEFLKKRQAT